MNEHIRFDCVKFQQDIRLQLLKEADYDLNKLAISIKENMKTNDLYQYFLNSVAKAKTQTTV